MLKRRRRRQCLGWEWEAGVLAHGHRAHNYGETQCQGLWGSSSDSLCFSSWFLEECVEMLCVRTPLWKEADWLSVSALFVICKCLLRNLRSHFAGFDVV